MFFRCGGARIFHISAKNRKGFQVICYFGVRDNYFKKASLIPKCTEFFKYQAFANRKVEMNLTEGEVLAVIEGACFCVK